MSQLWGGNWHVKHLFVLCVGVCAEAALHPFPLRIRGLIGPQSHHELLTGPARVSVGVKAEARECGRPARVPIGNWGLVVDHLSEGGVSKCMFEGVCVCTKS